MNEFIIDYGYWALAGLVLIDDLGVPMPGTTILFSSAVLASQNREISVMILFFIGFVVPPLGNFLLFYLSKKGLYQWLKSHGKKVFLPPKRLKKARDQFDKYGEKTVFLAAMFPNIRTVSSVIAGGLNMNTFKFVSYHILGLFIWASVVVSLGYFYGENIFSFGQTIWEFLFG